jgi:hypothetical protein
LGFRHKYKYGVLGAGPVGGSLIGRLPSRTRDVGPVFAASFRVASRIANTLRAGYPVRTTDDLGAAAAVLLYSPPEHLPGLCELLARADIQWMGKALIFCDCSAPPAIRERFEAKGASVAAARCFGIPPRIVVESAGGPSLSVVQSMSRDSRMKAVGITHGSADLFDAAVTLGSAAITPLIDRAASLLRDAGIRDIEAANIASSMFEQAARDYAHSGRQSWAWHARRPLVKQLEAQIAAVGTELQPVLRQLLLLGFTTFHKHEDVGAELILTPAPRTSGSRSTLSPSRLL